MGVYLFSLLSATKLHFFLGVFFHFIIGADTLIGLAGSGAGAFGGILVSSKLTQYRLEQLERKVEVHNQVIDRVYKLEERTEVQEEKIKVANRRIGDLENINKP
mgnify:CR=1 FL=1